MLLSPESLKAKLLGVGVTKQIAIVAWNLRNDLTDAAAYRPTPGVQTLL